MKDNQAEKEQAPSKINSIVDNWPPGMSLPIAMAMSDGTIAAVKTFVTHHGIDLSPTASGKDPAKEFMLRFTDEFATDSSKSCIYPFKRSFRDVYLFILNEQDDVLKALWLNNESDLAERMARVVSFGETLKFLESEKDEIKAEFDKIKHEK